MPPYLIVMNRDGSVRIGCSGAILNVSRTHEAMCSLNLKLRLRPLILLVAVSACGWVFSVQAAPSPEHRVTSDGIKGLVVNQTITANGYDFYLIFSALWREKPDGENYSLNIVERPSKRNGNHVFVYFGQRRVYTGVVPFKYDLIRPVCEKAVEESYTNIVAISTEAMFSGDPDIAKDEF